MLPVPDGTVVKTSDGELVVDLLGAGTQYVVAPGGKGGLGNAALASPRRKAPGFALLGEKGWHGDVVLELKTVADVALVGYPSAGKSSLVAALSAARPKIADYPFTTLVPNLGVVQAGDVRYTVADVPGLIPGASQGKGLGLEFLRHVERCSALVHVLDCATLEPGRDPLSDLEVIEAELAAYPVEPGTVPLVERPADRGAAQGRRAAGPRAGRAGAARPAGPRAAGAPGLLRQPRGAQGAVVRDGRPGGCRPARPYPRPSRERIVLRPKAVNAPDFDVAVENTSDGVRYRVRGLPDRAFPDAENVRHDFAEDRRCHPGYSFLADVFAFSAYENAGDQAWTGLRVRVVTTARDIMNCPCIGGDFYL